MATASLRLPSPSNARRSTTDGALSWPPRLCDAVATPPPVHVLAFSQGTATASRWVASGRVRAVRLVCWGGLIAPELEITSPSAPLRGTRVQLVLGLRDQFATPERVAAERARLDEAELPYEVITFDGGHRLDHATLARIASA